MNGTEMVDKPPYRVLLMRELNEQSANGFKVISTFSGGGGSSTGYRMAGFTVLWANEFVDAARATYAANHPTTKLDARDIRDVSGKDILAPLNLAAGDLDLFDGSPPCQSFSMSGKRSKGWGKIQKYADHQQRSDDLFFEYARLLREVRPKVFVAENVRGLVTGVAIGYFKDILKTLSECGYRVEARVVQAQWLGVPQARERIIFIGVREDLQLNPIFPKPLPYRYSLNDAIPWLGNVGAREVEEKAWMHHLAIGKEWQRLGIGDYSTKYFQLLRANPNVPSTTITTASYCQASITHPYECRKFSIAELKRICSFPDDYILTGTYDQQVARMGNAVPPVMMAAIARTIRDEILCKL